MRFPAALALVLVLAVPATGMEQSRFSDPVSVMIDHAKVLRLPERTQTVIVGIYTKKLGEELIGALTPTQKVIDLVNMPERAQLQGRYTGVCW